MAYLDAKELKSFLDGAGGSVVYNEETDNLCGKNEAIYAAWATRALGLNSLATSTDILQVLVERGVKVEIKEWKKRTLPERQKFVEKISESPVERARVSFRES